MIGSEKFKMVKELSGLGLNTTQISKKMQMDYRTVQRYMSMTDDEYESIGRKTLSGLEHYRDYILDIIKVCPQVRETNLLYRLREAFPEFNYKRATFYRYVKLLREQTGYVQHEVSRRRGIRSTPEPGYEGQVDFGQFKIVDMYGGFRRIYFFVMVLSYSNMRFVYFSAVPFTTATSIIAHEYAFRYFGGRPQMLVYDQDRVFVVSENYGNIILVKDFEEYVKKVGFSIFLCHAYDPMSKGRVEAIVGHTKRHFLDGRIYCGIDSLNSQCLEWLDKGSNCTFDYHKNATPKMLFENESKLLVPVKPCVVADQKVFYVRKGTHILYKKNQYAIPYESQRTCERVRIEESDGVLIMFDALTDEMMCKYTIPDSEGNVLSMGDNTTAMPTAKEHIVRLLDNDSVVITFVDGMENKAPRYTSMQCVTLVKSMAYFTKASMLEAMTHCNNIQRYKLEEILAYMIYKHGVDSVRKLTYHTQLSRCKLREKQIKEEEYGTNTND